MSPKTILFYFCLTVIRQCVKAVTVVEVSAGQLAILPCPSSDDDHRFMFWQLIDEKNIIGPGNHIDQEKYNYEVLTGKLYIKGVSTAEEGFYRCVSKGVINDSAFKSQVVELIVKKESMLGEDSFETKLLTGMAVTTVIIVGIAIILFVLLIKHRRTQGFFDLEDSRENSPARYVRTMQSTPAISVPKPIESEGIDNFGMEVDFPKVFQQMQKGETMKM
ncbi:uncharacterized protein LOC131673202 [Phymastichus coffea]|uniref:uncharacterized protein LOC131673202 n=1 Tax=Phymastichus coffea TaxID=108790 RepID=UPI00273BB757|nr:uncharacterized protein LOC131673202 [Phymastichus coffea]